MTPHPEATPETDAIGERIAAAAASVAAPEDLRRRIDIQRRPAARRPRRGGGRAPRMAAATLVAALVAIALVALLRDPRPQAPSFADATAVALRAPASPLPGDQYGSTLRSPTVDGVSFPNYAYSVLDLRAVGVRRDRSRGREVVAVSYDGGGARIGYAIVAAPAVKVPGGARTVTFRGTRYALLSAGAANVVTWRRAGRTCILASRTASHERLLRVAAWAAGGRSAS